MNQIMLADAEALMIKLHRMAGARMKFAEVMAKKGNSKRASLSLGKAEGLQIAAEMLLELIEITEEQAVDNAWNEFLDELDALPRKRRNVA